MLVGLLTIRDEDHGRDRFAAPWLHAWNSVEERPSGGAFLFSEFSRVICEAASEARYDDVGSMEVFSYSIG